ncbi:alpha/beta hydrolase domain-containing protein [Nocardioides anomalus]|uniref:alpha/beta hydrolase domain-containing protein n=1 Tax=Nocardioides anomalus TaxID=2712223 RepID=UPI001E41AF75|nr:alpha/beta hydrolase domain-containing protein [Nocardioides anomalus]
MTSFEALPPGNDGLLSARPGPDLAAWDYVRSEHVARGTAVSYAGHEPAAYATRVAVRRPASPGSFSGTVVVEWLNVSSGSDAAPDWTYLAAEIVRRGHAWVGVSAQHVGVEGGAAAVGVAGVAPTGIKGRQRYAALHHPGDAYSYSIFAQVAAALDDLLPDLVVDVRLALGESQSAYALTTFANVVHEQTGVFDGFLIHSRGAAAMPLGEPGEAVDPRAYRTGAAAPIRDDLDVPVLMVQTETDLVGLLDHVRARQPDGARVRLWEVAGTAHADRYVIGEFEAVLGCPRPVNRGQQAYVVRAALRWLDGWARDGDPAPTAARLALEGRELVRDRAGNAVGGVRTPCVEAPVETYRGDTDPDASYLCQLFGSTLPLDAEVLRRLWPDRAAYLAAYERATDAAVAAGFVLPEDRAEVLAEARPELLAD